MNPEQQRIAIAEACGWVERIYGSWGEPNNPPDRFGVKHKVWDDEDDLPDYLNDLNAMHEAEEPMTDAQCQQYVHHLATVTGAYFENPMGTEPLINHFTCYHATAYQRAEAFLKTIGKWKEEA